MNTKTQSTEKKLIDTRTFVEICKSASELEREYIRSRIMLQQLCTTRQTVYNWMAGSTIPDPFKHRMIARIVTAAIGKRCSGTTLFPKTK